jgi:hypothetical protein
MEGRIRVQLTRALAVGGEELGVADQLRAVTAALCPARVF